MDEPTTRRAWSKPNLTVLARGGPEEAVLDGCKVGGGADYTADNSGCFYLGDCHDCAEAPPS